jgi:hypothetical protein
MRAVLRRLSRPTRRRALELLAGCGVEGCADVLMLTRITAELVRADGRGGRAHRHHPVGSGAHFH